MIEAIDNTFYLNTNNTSYIFKISSFGHPEHVYYGEKLPVKCDINSLVFKRTAVTGGSVLYDESDETYSLDALALEWAGTGKGDFRHSPIELKMPDGTFVCDFVFDSYVTGEGVLPMQNLPCAHNSHDNNVQYLEITLKEVLYEIELKIIYTVFADCDVITRRIVLVNKMGRIIEIRRLMSLMLDMPDRNFSLTTLHGSWIREGQRQKQLLPVGVTIRESLTGNSSHRHNPAFALSEQGTDELCGRVYGFNLVYSGNHYEAVEKNEFGLVRLMSGINPYCFDWQLSDGSFETPEAVMTFSNQGFNGMSANFHNFIHNHIIPPLWRYKERPVLANSWEAH